MLYYCTAPTIQWIRIVQILQLGNTQHEKRKNSVLQCFSKILQNIFQLLVDIFPGGSGLLRTEVQL